jgi:transcriptional regulator with XRE-family HTH domain
VSTDPKDRWRDLGSFIREQRGTARLSLRRLSELAGISNPYLSQIERGLRRPSAEILQQIAKALRISAETLYVQAGILEPPDGTPDLSRLILADQTLSEDQKQALVRIYLSFRRDYENERASGHGHGHDHGHDHAPAPDSGHDHALSPEHDPDPDPDPGHDADPDPGHDPAPDAPPLRSLS